jgi:hypothetical protein
MAISSKEEYSEALKEFFESQRWIREYKQNYNPKYPRPVNKLTDEDVIKCRQFWPIVGTQQLADQYLVSRRTMENAVKGITFKHLNMKYRPWS